MRDSLCVKVTKEWHGLDGRCSGKKKKKISKKRNHFELGEKCFERTLECGPSLKRRIGHECSFSLTHTHKKVAMISINEGRPQKVKAFEGRGKGIGFR